MTHQLPDQLVRMQGGMTLMGRSPQAVPRLNADVQEITMELLESGVVFTMACDKNKALARLSIVLLQNVLNFPAENKG